MKPLDHLTILDLSRVLACPFASMILAELGARVIKVEQPGSGDETRSFEPQLAADLTVMAEGAKLGYPEAKHGIVAAIVMANLVRQVGRKAAFEMVSLGDPVDAQRALQLGLVNRVCPLNELLPTAVALAEKLAAVKRTAMAETKRLFHEVADLALGPALKQGRDSNVRMRKYDSK